MTATVRRRRGRGAPSKEQLDGISLFVTRRTSEMRERGLRFDWGRLSAADQTELVALQAEAEGDEHNFDLERLSKRESRRWETLIGKAVGDPDFFEHQRIADEIRALAREGHRAAVKRPHGRKEEQTLFSELAAQVVGGYLWADHVAVLIMILLQWEAGVAFSPRSRVETIDGLPVLVLDASFGIVVGDLDERGILAAWKQGVAHLELNAWIEVARNGNEWTIAPGLRAKRAIAGATAA